MITVLHCQIMLIFYSWPSLLKWPKSIFVYPNKKFRSRNPQHDFERNLFQQLHFALPIQQSRIKISTQFFHSADWIKVRRTIRKDWRKYQYKTFYNICQKDWSWLHINCWEVQTFEIRFEPVMSIKFIPKGNSATFTFYYLNRNEPLIMTLTSGHSYW